MSEQVKEIKLTYDEKEKLIKYFREQSASYSGRKSILGVESKLIEDVIPKIPANAPDTYVVQLKAKATEWKNKLIDIDNKVSIFNAICSSISDNKVINIKDIKSYLADLAQRERGTKKVDAVYNYYPSLKKAKELSLHEFANKIKTIMEYEHVKIA